MRDARNGGYHWLVDRNGRLVDPRKHLYAQCFVIYGLSEYARTFGGDEILDEVLTAFEVLEAHAHDDVNGGYFEVFSSDWRERIEGDTTYGGVAGGKRNCPHISLLEALPVLLAATGDSQVHARLDEAINVLVACVDDTGFMPVVMSDDWKDLQPGLLGYGHDLKLAWSLRTAARAVDREHDPDVNRTARALVDHAYRYGFDQRHGGVSVDTGPSGQRPRWRAEWWVQAEALVGFLDAYELTGAEHHLQAFERQAGFVFKYFVDHQFGDWFTEVAKHGVLTNVDKGSHWKGPYHQARACSEVVQRLGSTAHIAMSRAPRSRARAPSRRSYLSWVGCMPRGPFWPRPRWRPAGRDRRSRATRVW